MIYLDTHVVAWLYVGRVDLFTRRGTRLLNEEELLVSPMVVLELEYLREVARLKVGADVVMQALQVQLGLRICDVGFPKIAERAGREHWTRDPFDRLIVSHAALSDSPLITKDQTIRKHYRRAVW